LLTVIYRYHRLVTVTDLGNHRYHPFGDGGNWPAVTVNTVC
jgi:hypothetical protein